MFGLNSGEKLQDVCRRITNGYAGLEKCGCRVAAKAVKAALQRKRLDRAMNLLRVKVVGVPKN